MLFVPKKMANQSIVVARNCRKFNYRFFAFMSNAKNFSKSTKIDKKASQSMQSQLSQQPPQSQQTTGLEEKQSAENTMVGANHNGKTDKEVLKPNTDSNGKTPQEHLKPKPKPNTDSGTNQNSNQDPKKPINLKNSDIIDFKKWIAKEWVKAVGFTTLIAIFIEMYQIKLQIEALKEDQERFQKGEETKREQFQKQMMEKYGSIQVRADYVDSPLEEQVRKLLNYNDQDRIKIIVGCPGIGKTAAIKKILSEMKKENTEVFYFSFGDKNQDKKQMAMRIEQFYGLMEGIITKFVGQPKYAGKKVKVVLDDINQLEKEKQIFNKVMKDIYLEMNYGQIDINCISSSGSFIDNLLHGQRWKSFSGKYGSMQIIQNHQHPEKLRQFQIKILSNKYGQRIKQIIKDAQGSLLISEIVDIGLITRELEEFTKLFLDSIEIKQKITIQEAKRLLKGYENGKIQLLAGDVFDLMVQIKDKNQKIRFLSHFLSSEEKLNFQKCREIKKFSKYSLVFKKVFTELEKKNMIIFCRPRSRYQEKAFRTLMKKYQQSSLIPFL